MFLWTMVLPLPVIEKEGQAKPCGLAPDVLAQGVAVPAASRRARYEEVWDPSFPRSAPERCSRPFLSAEGDTLWPTRHVRMVRTLVVIHVAARRCL